MSSGDEGTVGQVPRPRYRDDHHQIRQVRARVHAAVPAPSTIIWSRCNDATCIFRGLKTVYCNKHCPALELQATLTKILQFSTIMLIRTFCPKIELYRAPRVKKFSDMHCTSKGCCLGQEPDFVHFGHVTSLLSKCWWF